MKTIIHYNGNYEDTLEISGDTMDELKEIAHTECDRRGWELSKCWSEVAE